MENLTEMSGIVGPSFEDMTISEMTLVQGSGDITPESTPVCVVVSAGAAVSGAAASWNFSVGVVKTVKGHC